MPCTALVAASWLVTTEIRISDVVIMVMLMPASARALKNVADTPGWERIPAPIRETFAIPSSEARSWNPISSCARRRASSASGARPPGR